jgi:flagellar motility protein MotE (MotC chaperone)
VALRLIPIVLFATSALLALKAADTLGARRSLAPVPSAQAAGAPAQPAGPATSTQRPVEQPLPQAAQPSAEQGLLERLAERRRQLEERARELDQREAMLRAAETRVEQRVEELRRIEQRVDQGVQARQDEQNQQLRGLITMYENMKPKEAARIFDRLDMEVLIAMATRMNPRRMSEVMAEMQPEAAQRLTVALARRAGANASAPPAAAAPATPQAAPSASPPSAPGARELPRIDQRRS